MRIVIKFDNTVPFGRYAKSYNLAHARVCFSNTLTQHQIGVCLRSGSDNDFFPQISVACICLFVILPLTMVGAILGRNISGQPDNPCRINTVPRPIPEKKWFMEPWAIVLLGGVLPFGSIFIEV